MATWEELYDSAAERLAWGLLPLVLEPDGWIQRRVEHVTISSQRLVRRSVTVDLVVPEAERRQELKLDPADPASPLVVPLGVLRKEQLIDFDLAEGSASLPLVRSALNVVIAAALLGNVAEVESQASRAEIDAALPWLRRIAAPDRRDAHRAYRQLFGGEGDVPAPARSLARGDTTASLARQLRDSYLLLVEMPDAEARHRLIRFATDQSIKDVRTRIEHRLGLRPVAVEFPIPGATQTPSYHAEFTVPAGCLVVGAGVAEGQTAIAAAVDLSGRRASVYPHEPLTGEAVVTLEIGQEPRFYFLPAAVISGLVSVLLAAGVVVAWAGGTPETTASALVLSGLGAITGLVIQRDEAALTSELHSAARLVLTMVTVAALGAAAAIAFGARDGTLAALWSASLCLSVLGAGTLGFGAFMSARAKQRAQS